MSTSFPAPTHGIKVTTTAAKVLLGFCHRLPGSYEGIPSISDIPFLVENRCGKGRTYYLAVTFGAGLGQFRFPEYFQLVKNLTHMLSPVQVAVENAPGVEVSLRKKETITYLHLINHTGGLKRPLTGLHTLRDMKIHLRLNAKEARVLRANKKIALR